MPIPASFHGHREVAKYFQTLALLREPVQSWYHLTPAESASDPHLHSLVSALLLYLGEIEAGAAMALMYGDSAAYFTGKIVAIYSSPVIGGLAAMIF